MPFTASAHTGEGTVDEYPDISGITTAREAMRKMTEEDKQKIAQQVELFRKEKMTFDSEVAKWDDTGNDIIFLAKHMCMIMMEMTDFTRYVLSIQWRWPKTFNVIYLTHAEVADR